MQREDDARSKDRPEPWSQARELVLQYGWNATSYQILNPGIRRWISSRGDGVIGYVRRVGVRVVAGAPVAASGMLNAVAQEFEAEAFRRGERVCYFGAEGRFQSLLLDRSPRTVPVSLGAQPVCDPQEWQARVYGSSTMRAQLNRARNKGVTVRRWSSRAAENDPELEACLDEWMANRGLPPLHFLVESDTLSNLQDRRIYVACRSGRVVGFVVASPVAARNGWLLEQVVRRPTSPNGTAELMIDFAARELAEEGATYLTLGLAPLARLHSSVVGPSWLRVLLLWLRAHGRRFYNFEGLEYFKGKFSPPTWEPVHAAVPGATLTPRILYAIAAAFSSGPPPVMVLRGLWHAAREEIARSRSNRKHGKSRE